MYSYRTENKDMKSAPKCLLLFYNLLNINILPPPPAYKQRNSYLGSIAFGAAEMLCGCFGVSKG